MAMERLSSIGSILGAVGVYIALSVLTEQGELADIGWFLGFIVSLALVAIPWYRVSQSFSVEGERFAWLRRRFADLFMLSLLVSGTVFFTAFGFIGLAIASVLAAGLNLLDGTRRLAAFTGLTAVVGFAILGVSAMNPLSMPAVAVLMAGVAVLTVTSQSNVSRG